jgi:hypothetical protein
MTTMKRYTSWLAVGLLSIAASGCGSDDIKTPSASTSNTGATAGSTSAGSAAAADPNAAATCPTKVYAALSDGCKTCACGLDPQLAPSCQKPCWDFLACSMRAQTGKCATFAAGGASMRTQFEACTMEECGAELAVPGAEVISAYRSIVGGCVVAMGGNKAACEDDVAKFISELAP